MGSAAQVFRIAAMSFLKFFLPTVVVLPAQEQANSDTNPPDIARFYCGYTGQNAVQFNFPLTSLKPTKLPDPPPDNATT